MAGGGSDGRVPYLGPEDKLLKEGIRSSAKSYFDLNEYIGESGIESRAQEDYWSNIAQGVFASKSLNINTQAANEIDRVNSMIAAGGLSDSGIGAKAAAQVGGAAVGQISQFAAEAESYTQTNTTQGQADLFNAMNQLSSLQKTFVEAQRARSTRMAEWKYRSGYEVNDADVKRLNRQLGIRF